MNEHIKQFVTTYVMPALFWLVRRLLPVFSGLLLKLGIDHEQFVTVVVGGLTFIVSCVLMRAHNKLLARSAAHGATHDDRKSL